MNFRSCGSVTLHGHIFFPFWLHLLADFCALIILHWQFEKKSRIDFTTHFRRFSLDKGLFEGFEVLGADAALSPFDPSVLCVLFLTDI